MNREGQRNAGSSHIAQHSPEVERANTAKLCSSDLRLACLGISSISQVGVPNVRAQTLQPANTSWWPFVSIDTIATSRNSFQCICVHH